MLKSLSANFTASNHRLVLGNLSLPFAPWRIDQLILTCADGRFKTTALECSQGQLTLRFPRFDQTLRASTTFTLSPVWGQVRLDPLRHAFGYLRLQADYLGRRWQTKLKVLRQPLQLGWIKPKFPKLSWLAKLKGAAKFELLASGAVAPERIDLRLTGEKLTFQNLGFTRVIQKLKVLLQLQSWQVESHWRGRLELEIPQGESLYFPVYLSFQEHPVKLTTAFLWKRKANKLLLQDLHLSQQNVLTAIAEASFSDGILAALTASFAADLPTLFQLYGRPFLAGGQWEGIQVQAGKTHGRLTLGDQHKARVWIEDAVVTDREHRLGINQLSADLAWQQRLTGQVSRLSWHAGHLYAIPVGAAELFFRLTGDDFRLCLPTDLPILDGHLLIDQLEIFDLSTTPVIRFRGRLDKISLEVLTRVLGWPPLAGTLSGDIPQVTYDLQQRTLKLDGRLTIEVFGGTVVIQNLVITDLFGVLPRLKADVYFYHLDLEQITKRFAFGRITGRLAGHIQRLYLENWQPIFFDAWFGTPAGDRTHHRISQQAVKNLANLGSGFAADLLSRTLLGWLQEFNYDALGLGCRLRDGVCELAGIAPAPNGYYIVKGGGLPRIDVIGYNRRIDWLTLTTRLARITQLR